MGYGEFVGGGSVAWKITHTHGDHGSGGVQGGSGRDKDPAPNSGASFTVWAIDHSNGVGQFLGSFPADDFTIKVEWAPHTDLTPGAALKPAMKAARAKTAARKSYKSAKA